MRARAIRAALGASGLAFAVAAQAGPYTEAGYAPVLMTAWATSVDELVRGPRDIASPGLGDASFGNAAEALGPPGEMTAYEVVSLGDGGHITLHFSSGIGDGPGDDFAVYENGFETLDGLFAELAFVEVSSDGVVFHRFDAATENTAPVSGPNGDTIDPTDYHNFGGKHEQGVGTGFDLSELGLSEVSYVRLVDVIGTGDPAYATQDHLGNTVYDPYATPFDAGGFDLDAVGVLHVPEPGALAAQLAAVSALAVLSRRRRAGSCGRGG